MRTFFVFIVAGMVAIPFSPSAAEPPRHGTVRLERHVLLDDDGPFLGLGATYMQALRHAKFEPDRLNKELSFLGSCGFQYVRVLAMVDWLNQEITPASHTKKNGAAIAAWPDYDQILTALVDAVHSYGMRTELTLFADAPYVMPSAEARRQFLRHLLVLLKDREEKIILYEIANEAWQNGFPDDAGMAQLRALGAQAAALTPIPIALSSPPGLENLMPLYRGSKATLATMHFSRDTRTELGAWLPVVDCWKIQSLEGLPPVSSNEPIGPGASVASEDDPERIFAAAAFAYLSGLPMYVLHSDAGVYAKRSFDTMPWLRQFKALLALLPRDLPNWSRFDANAPENPLTPRRPVASPLFLCGARNGNQFVLLPLALNGGTSEFTAQMPLTMTIYALPACNPIAQVSVAEGETIRFETAPKACLMVGETR